MFRFVLTVQAQKEIKRISTEHQKAIRLALLDLKENPLVGKRLNRELAGRFSYRVGVYRIIYSLNSKDKIITVLTAGHRARVYK